MKRFINFTMCVALCVFVVEVSLSIIKVQVLDINLIVVVVGGCFVFASFVYFVSRQSKYQYFDRESERRASQQSFRESHETFRLVSRTYADDRQHERESINQDRQNERASWLQQQKLIDARLAEGVRLVREKNSYYFVLPDRIEPVGHRMNDDQLHYMLEKQDDYIEAEYREM